MDRGADSLPSREVNPQSTEVVRQLPENPHVKRFAEDFLSRIQGNTIEADLQERKEAIEPAVIYAGNLVNDSALAIAGYAHIAELFVDPTLRRDVALALKKEFPESPDDIPNEKRYTLGILFAIAEIRLETKDMLGKSQDLTKPVLDHEVLTRLAKTTDLEAVIDSAAAHYSEFMYLVEKRSIEYGWDESHESRLRHLAVTIRSVDTILLELSGFDALAANALSPVYIWDLENRDRHEAVQRAEEIVAGLGGYEQIANATDDFLGIVFQDHAISEVASEQVVGGLRYTDGVGDISPGEDNQLLVRVLTRLKSPGSLAQKIDHSGKEDDPADISGIAIVVDDPEEVPAVVDAIISNLVAENTEFVCAPSRDKQIQIKGSQDFIDSIDGNVDFRDITTKSDVANNGFEAVKITVKHTYQGIDYPIEIQVTHDIARRNSRRGMASHAIFKLAKLLDIDLSHEELSRIAAELGDQMYERKQALAKGNQHLCDPSNERVNRFLEQPVSSLGLVYALGRTACINPFTRV